MMEQPVIDDNLIREYLLGRVEDPEVIERFDERLLTNPEFSTSVDIIEDEIIEEYLEVSLNADDLRDVEKHFLRPPERQRKLRQARLLNRHLAAGAAGKEDWRQPEPERHTAPGRSWKFPASRAWLEIAAAVICMVSIAYLAYQHHQLTMVIGESRQQLAEARSQVAALNQQLETQLPILSTEVLRLLEPGNTRDITPVSIKLSPVVFSPSIMPEGDQRSPTKARSISRRVRVQIAVPNESINELHSPTDTYRVRLEHQGQILWSQTEVTAHSVPGGTILELDLPAQTFPAGTSHMLVSRPGRADLSYSFAVSNTP